jgi:hypothetical protein
MLESRTYLNDGFDDNKTNLFDADTYSYIKANKAQDGTNCKRKMTIIG